jgi:hypothetical protein
MSYKKATFYLSVSNYFSLGLDVKASRSKPHDTFFQIRRVQI